MSNVRELPALMVLDVQKGFDDPYWGERNNPNAEGNIKTLLTEWRKRKGHVIFSKHLSVQPGSPLHYKNEIGTEFKEFVKPEVGELVITKNVNSAFIGTEIETYLKQEKITSVIITGLSTQHCISTTTRMSGNLGYNTYLVSDAIAAFGITDHKGTYYSAEAIHNHELAMLQNEFATIVTTNEILTQLNNG